MAVKDEKYAAAMAYFADLAEKQKKNAPDEREQKRKYESYLESQRLAFEDACAHNPDLCLFMLRPPLPPHFSRYGSVRVEVEALTPAGFG